MKIHKEPLTFFLIFILYRGIIDEQCCVTFRCTANCFSYKYASIRFQILSPFRLLQNILQSSLCYTVGPCWLSIKYLNTVVCICHKRECSNCDKWGEKFKNKTKPNGSKQGLDWFLASLSFYAQLVSKVLFSLKRFPKLWVPNHFFLIWLWFILKLCVCVCV